jgi:hypothetical protein
MRTVKTASGDTAVQVVHFSRRGLRDIERIGCGSRGTIYGLACGGMPIFTLRINAQRHNEP